MAWAVPLHRGNQVCYLGAEAVAFGTLAANPKRIYLVGNTPPLGKAARKMLPNADIRVRRNDAVSPVAGLMNESPVELSVYAKATKTALDAGAAPSIFSAAGALSHQIVYRAQWGAEVTPHAGTTIEAYTAAAPPALASVEVAAGTGALFLEGEVIAVEVGATGGDWEYKRITEIAGDVLTVAPAFNVAPYVPVGKTGKVRALYNYYLPESLDTQSYSVQTAYYETAAEVTQRQGLGCTFTGSETLAVGEVPTVKLAGKSATHTAPGDLSLTVDEAADDVGAPIVWEPCGALFTSLATAPSAIRVHEASYDLQRSWQDVPGCGVEGLLYRVETAGRDKRPTITLKGTTQDAAGDPGSPWTLFSGGSALSLLLFTKVGSGTDARVKGFWFPRLVLESEPVYGELGELVTWEATFTAHLARDAVAYPPASTDTALALAPAIMFWG